MKDIINTLLKKGLKNGPKELFRSLVNILFTREAPAGEILSRP